MEMSTDNWEKVHFE